MWQSFNHSTFDSFRDISYTIEHNPYRLKYIVYSMIAVYFLGLWESDNMQSCRHGKRLVAYAANMTIVV